MNYVRNAWYVASWVQDLEPDKPTAITILGEPIVLWRAGEQLVAMADRCVHRMAPLSLGRCEGMTLRCMYHGLVFGTDGVVVEIPGQAVIPPQARVKSYRVVEKHSWVWVWMGDPALADETLIPAAIGFDHPDYILGRGALDYAAEARLVNDNLLDFSHVSFVHANSFGGDFSSETPKLTPLPRGVRFERWLPNSSGPGGVAGGLFDSWTSYDFLLPGVLLMYMGNFPLGTAAACNGNAPDLALAVGGVSFTNQAVTPIDARQTRYFYSWGPHRQHGDEALRDILIGIATMAFGEDKVIIEAQQKVIDRETDQQIMPTVHDRGVTLFNRLVERMVREESVGGEARAA